MMRTIQLAVACVAVLVASAGQVQAGMITFDSNPDFSYFVTPIYSAGFKFSDITGEGSLGTAKNLDSTSVDNGTVHLMDWVNGGAISTARMEASDSSLFSLSSFDFTSGYLNGSRIASQLSVTGYDIGGGIIANAIFTSSNYSNLVFTQLNLSGSFQNLRYVTFEATGLGNRVGYDNIVVNAPAGTVPEPSSIALFGIGACVMGLSASRHRRRSKK